MSVAVYEGGLRGSAAVQVRYADGSVRRLAVERWHGPARGADRSLLDRVDGPTLDIGCGPGRLVAALTQRGIWSLGIDIAPAAVGLTRLAGAAALQVSVFDEIPGAGEWHYGVLADGNIGIGGDPVRLLRRVAQLLTPDGQVLVELDPPGTAGGSTFVRLETDAAVVGDWFPWAHVGADALEALAAAAGLRVVSSWTAQDLPATTTRWFAALTRAR